MRRAATDAAAIAARTAATTMGRAEGRPVVVSRSLISFLRLAARVPDGPVALDAGCGVLFVEGVHRVHQLAVAVPARGFGDPAIRRGDADRLVEGIGG